MTDRILELAVQAGFEPDCCSKEWHARMARFAALVRRDALEEAAGEVAPFVLIEGNEAADMIRALAAQEEA